MNNGKQISQVLFVFVLCILILYLGFQSEVTVSDEFRMQLDKKIFEQAQKVYLTSLSFQKEGKSVKPQQWLVRGVMNLFPLGCYVEEHIPSDLQVEDQETYAMILEKQAHDENEVDEQGNLVGKKEEEVSVPAKEPQKLDLSLDKLKDYEYLVSHFYTVDGSTAVSKKDLDAEKLLGKNLKLDTSMGGPKILVYHTHSQEDFADSEKGNPDTTIMGMGAYLSELLNNTYGIETLHHEGVYDLIDGEMDRSKAYQLAEKKVKKILKENPSIEVVIDLHRDGVGKDTHLVTEVNGKPTAQIMFFNGMSRTKANGDIAYLENPYLQDNLAMSLQMQLKAAEKYPGFTRRIYLKSYRYNLHLKPKSMLIEAGAQTNTVEEMRNAMEVLADVLNGCLK